MPLAPGAWLNHYEVLGHLGTGGMGEVYRARDNKLQREVALKVLPKAFAQDPERVARFRREAQVLAQLNHVNIAAIYSVEQSGETHFLVMELAEGETLGDRIQRSPEPSRAREQAAHPALNPSRAHEAKRHIDVVSGHPSPVPLDEALDITKQIAAGLEAAHEKPIVHRDLKPANVKVTPEGVVKILDFGLARAFAGDTGSGDPADSPTLTGMTQPGTILGTAAYMSPEQARGKKVDKRTDIWALGCVLYELLTGKHAFDGEDVPEILAAVMKGDPDWSSLPASTPPNVRFVLRRCLEKDAKRRFHSATDVAITLEEPWSVAAAEAPAPVAAPAPPAWRRALPFVLTGLVAAVIAGGIGILTRPTVPTQPVSRVVIPLGADEQFPVMPDPSLAISPNGTHLAYIAGVGGVGTQRQLYLRVLESQETRQIPETEGADTPFFSPDGQWLGFFADAKLKKVAVSGGAALTLAEAPNIRGASWGRNDAIVFNQVDTEVLWQVSGAGGTPQQVTTRKEGETGHRWPHFLPDGKTVLFTVVLGPGPDDSLIAALRLDTGEQKVLIRGGTNAQYVPTGHLVYYRAGTITAVPFDPARLEVKGTPAPAIEGVMGGFGNSGAGQFSFSNQGALIYVPGNNQGTASQALSLVWVDRNGAETPLAAPARAYDHPRISPDGQQVALIEEDTNDVWIYNIPRVTLTRLTFEGSAAFPVWTPDGKKIAFAATRSGAWGISWKAADGSGAEERLATKANQFLVLGQGPTSITPDGRVLAFQETGPGTGLDIWMLPLECECKPQPFLQTRFQEGAPMFSPDGRWLAYVSGESGRAEVYVQPFPGPGGKFQISTEGALEPLWARNGRELFYRSGNRMMAVDITTQPTFRAGAPRMLFEGPNYLNSTAGRARFDISPDGQRFLMLKPVEQETAALTQINVVLNWFEELRRRVPVP